MNVSDMIVPAQGTFFLVLGGYFVIMAAIGYFSARRTDSLREFFVMGGRREPSSAASPTSRPSTA